MSRLPALVGLVLLAVATATAAAIYWPTESNLGQQVERSLGDSLRTFEGRPGSFVSPNWYASYRQATPEITAQQLEGLRATRGILARSNPPIPLSDELTARGLLYLSQNEIGSALAELKAAADYTPKDPLKLTDLAVAYLARFRMEEKPTDLLLAFEASERAWREFPNSTSVCFTRSIILTKLGLRQQAIAAWQHYRSLDPSSAWAQEANAYLEELTGPTIAERWEIAQQKIDVTQGPPTKIQIEYLVDLFPFKTRTWAEEDLLGLWAERQPDPESRKVLDSLKIFAAVLSQRNRSDTLLDSVGVIEKATTSGDRERVALLAKGHHFYKRATQAYAEQDLVLAARYFAEASLALEKAKSPFYFWATLHLAICTYYSDTKHAGKKLHQLLSELPPGRYDDLRGRVYWLLGTVALVQENPEAALKSYREGFELLQNTLGESGSGFVRLVEAEALGRLGEIEESWRQRLTALHLISEWNDPRRMHGALTESIQMLIRQRLHLLAEPFLQELRQNAETWGNPTAIAEAALQRARIALELGDVPGAHEALEDASSFVARIPEGSLQDFVQFAVDSEQARAMADAAPTKAIAKLNQAIELQRKIGYDFDYIRLVIARAKAYLLTNQNSAAEQDLGLAIEAYEAIRSGVGDEQLRISAFSQAQPAFDLLMEHLMEQEAPADRSLELAERARTRFLLDLRRKSWTDLRVHSDTKPVSVMDLKTLPEGTRVLIYYVLPDRVLGWLADRHSIRLHVQKIAEDTLETQVSLLRNELERSANNPIVDSAAAALADVLIRPFAEELEGTRHLVVIPDRFLQRIPFMLLPNPSTQLLLIENFPVSIAPSLTIFLGGDYTRTSPVDLKTAMVVGDPAFSKDAYPSLEDLGNASDEARRVASFYPGSYLLESASATEETILQNMDSYDVFHFAGHAQANPSSIRLSRLLAAPDPGRTDGAILAQELPTRFERTHLVVLSACRTLDSTSRDREDLLGLASVFLVAGVPNVVASLWDADDSNTRRLMIDFHQRISAGSSPIEALRQAALVLRRNKLPPKVWAAFQAVVSAPVADRRNTVTFNEERIHE